MQIMRSILLDVIVLPIVLMVIIAIGLTDITKALLEFLYQSLMDSE